MSSFLSLCAWECFRVLEKCLLESRWLHACSPTGEFPTPSRPSSPQPVHLIPPRCPIDLKHSSDKVIPLVKAVHSSSWEKEKTPEPGSEAFLTLWPTHCQSSPHILLHTHPNSRQARLLVTLTLYFMRSNLSSYQTFHLEGLPHLNPSESYQPSGQLLQDAFSELPVMSAACKSRAVFLCRARGLNTCSLVLSTNLEVTGEQGCDSLSPRN